jgi:hypothetical protein
LFAQCFSQFAAIPKKDCQKVPEESSKRVVKNSFELEQIVLETPVK